MNSKEAIQNLLLAQPVGGVAEVCEEDLAVLHALPVTVQIVSYEGTPRSLYANKGALEAFGMTYEEFRAQDIDALAGAEEKAKWERRYESILLKKETILEREDVQIDDGSRKLTQETVYSPVVLKSGEENVAAVMVTTWPLKVRTQLSANIEYMTSLLERSPYPLCFFTLDGHLITCNPAAVAVFGKTIWLQSDIFGMEEHERRGINLEWCRETPSESSVENPFVERTERLSAYEAMMEALSEDGATYEVDLPIKRIIDTGEMVVWYCRVFAQRHKDPVTCEPIIMVSHQDVTNLRKVEGELGRMQMAEHTGQLLMKQHDSDVAGSLMVLLGEDWNFLYENTASRSADEVGSAKEGFSSPVHFTGEGYSSNLDASGNISNKTVQLSGLRSCLDKADEWEFNVFDLEREADGLPLQVLCWHVFLKHNLLTEFNLDHVKLVNFLRSIESGQQDNPYHNATHVADVVQSMHVILCKGGIGKFVGKFEILAGLIAATIHDYEHRGFNNDFLIKTNDEWAIDSNDKAPNESHHLSAAFRILRHQDCNFLHRMPLAQQQQLRKLIIEMVLATDMAEHMAIVSKLKSDIQKRLENPDDDILDEPSDSLKILVLQGAIKVADVGHLYAQHDVHLSWSERLEEEMWLQGDVEKQLSMKVSFLMDRDSPGVTKSQPGFFDFVVRPLFETWCACFPESNVLLERIEVNYQHWKLKESKAA